LTVPGGGRFQSLSGGLSLIVACSFTVD
jgi:hypothetical protein